MNLEHRPRSHSAEVLDDPARPQEVAQRLTRARKAVRRKSPRKTGRAISATVAGLLCVGAWVLIATFGGSAVTAYAAGSSTQGSGSAAAGSPHSLLPAAIQSSGVLNVASSIGYPPFEYYASNGKTFIGLDIDILHALGPVLGVKVNIMDTQYSAIPTSLLAGRADIGMSSFEEVPSEYKTLTFVSYLRLTGAVLVASSNKTVRANDPTSLCGLPVGVVEGESDVVSELQALSAKCAKLGKPGVTVKQFQRDADALLALQSGVIDARPSTGITAAYTVAHSNGKFKNIALSLDAAPINGIAIPAGHRQLALALQAGMEELKRDGKYPKILAKWGVPSEAVKQFSIVPK